MRFCFKIGQSYSAFFFGTLTVFTPWKEQQMEAIACVDYSGRIVEGFEKIVRLSAAAQLEILAYVEAKDLFSTRTKLKLVLEFDNWASLRSALADHDLPA